jgi:hypothetical protein
VSQLALWVMLPRARVLPPKSLAALEGAIGVGSIVAAILASAWLLLPAVTALATAAALLRLRETVASPAVAGAPPSAEPAPPSPSRTSMEELRAARRGVHRFFVAAMTCFLVLAGLFAVMATAEPVMLVLTALFVALAGAVRFAAWLWVQTTPAAVRREMERAAASRRRAPSPPSRP